MLPKIQKILYCTDMGRNTSYVFRWAYALAVKFGAEITVLHVMETLSRRQRAMVEGYSGLGTVEGLIDKVEKEAAERLPKRIEEFCARETPDDDWHKIVTRIVVAEGNVTEEILEHVESTGADVVVVGAHGRLSLLDRFVGSTARRLTEVCPVPLLTVQVPEGKQDMTLLEGQPR